MRVRIAMSVSQETSEALKKMAEEHHWSQSKAAQVLVEEGLKREAKKK